MALRNARWIARRSAPAGSANAPAKSAAAVMRASISSGRLRATWLRAHADTGGRRNFATSAAVSLSPAALSCLANALRAATNSSGSAA